MGECRIEVIRGPADILQLPFRQFRQIGDQSLVVAPFAHRWAILPADPMGAMARKVSANGLHAALGVDPD
jgi:hypothetical protein